MTPHSIKSQHPPRTVSTTSQEQTKEKKLDVFIKKNKLDLKSNKRTKNNHSKKKSETVVFNV